MAVVDGNALAKEIRARVLQEVSSITQAGGKISFAAVIVGNDPSSLLYIDKKSKACREVGIEMTVHKLGERDRVTQIDLNNLLKNLSADNKVHGILLQLPLPHGLDANEAVSHISPCKDVDGLTAENFGRLACGKPGLVPCTALGILHILKSCGVPLAGKKVTVVGRSNIVGKPTAFLLMNSDATVTVAHSKTKDLIKHTIDADIIVVAAGSPGLLKGDMVKDGVIIIDVGINRKDGHVVGDVDFEDCQKKASIITPVPGGVGPLTIAFLLSNIIQAYNFQIGGGKVNV